MPTLKLTRRTIDEIESPKQGQVFYRDAQLRGFGVRVGKASKVFIVEGQVNHQTRRVTIGRADVLSPEVARKRALQILGEMSEGVDPALARRKRAQELTVQAAFDAFFEAKTSLAACTVECYRRSINLYLRDWKARKLTSISRSMVLTRHRAISQERGGVTANNVFRHFRSVYNFTAACFDDFPLNPSTILTQARAWNSERRRRTLIAVHNFPAWWSALEADSRDARDILRLAVLTGMRRSEVIGLRWEHLDLISGTLTLPKTKNGDPLVLPLAPYVKDMITARREIVGQSEWVFPGKGRTRHICEVKTMIARLEKASGVAFTMHDLRRTFITIAESLDIPHYALKRLLNHRTDSDVTGGYIVINEERLRGPVERIAARILELADRDQISTFRPEGRCEPIQPA